MNRDRQIGQRNAVTQTGAAIATSETTRATQPIEEPLFIDDLARILHSSTRTIQRMLRAGSFPIPTLPRLDRVHRWSPDAVRQFIAEGHQLVRVHGARNSTRGPQLVPRKDRGEAAREGGTR